MLDKLKKRSLLLALLLIGAFAFYRGITFLDPDFGWHIRTGEIILQNGIPQTDPFSYSMPSFPFIDHEWGTNVLMFAIYDNLGVYILSFIFSLIFILSLYISIPFKFKKYSLLPLILAGGAMLNFTGLRPQVITWFFVSLLLKLLLDGGLFHKWKFIIPLLFIIWVNLHGGFAIGIVMLFLFFAAKSIKERRFSFGFFSIFIFSILATFINPYGPRIWYEIWMQIADNSLRWKIAEWIPSAFFFELSFLFLLTTSAIFVFKYRKNFDFLELAIYFFLLAFALSSIRHIPLWAIAAISLTPKAFFHFSKEAGKNKLSKKRYGKAKVILIIIVLGVFTASSYQNLKISSNLTEKNFYPREAVIFLNRQRISGNVLSTYDYGGYLIWKMPNHKVFIDGRMPSWRRGEEIPNESSDAFSDIRKMFSDKKFMRESVEKYDIEYVLVPKTKEPGGKKTFGREYLENLDTKLFGQNRNNLSSSELQELGFERIYNDGKFEVYRRQF